MGGQTACTQNKGGSQRINMTLPACPHCTDLDLFLTSKRYMKGRKWAAEEKEKINRQCFFSLAIAVAARPCVPWTCGDFALKVPQLFFIECPIIAGGRWRERGKGSDSSSTLKVFVLSRRSLPPSLLRVGGGGGGCKNFTANGFTFIFSPSCLGGNPPVFSLFAFAFLHVATTPLSPVPPPAEKKSTTSLFPPLHTGFFLSIRGREQGKTKKIFPLPIRSFGVKRKRKKGKFLCHVVVVFVVTPGWGKKSAAFFRICGKKSRKCNDFPYL